MNLAEVTAALTLAALGAGVSVPAVAGYVRSARLDSAAREVSLAMMRARMEAVARGTYTGLRFEPGPGGGRYTLYQDGGSKGIRTAEILAGVEQPLGASREIGQGRPGVRLGLPPVTVPRVPPAAGHLSPGDDPIAFSGTDIFSCAPTGETSTGTVYLTDGVDMRAVVVFGPTGRLRVAAWDATTRRWRP